MLNMGNNRLISDSRPSIYFKNLETLLGDKLEDVLLSNFIDMYSFNAALSEDYEQFIKIRSELIIDTAARLCGDK